MDFLELGGEKWSVPFFKKHSVEKCRKMLPHKSPNQVTNVWKQINGKTKKKYLDKEGKGDIEKDVDLTND